ncbi:cytochrome P450 [Nocardia sp. alder85J]|uniref:cytochrome P450 n=1 Tax=Nocardia sp. alder85J TaxID=2862949 RepID=UPI001CD6E961|nr:cytochrome P450 [Nocardia sp. alder85J]MCX4095901.1 cytochrome P450 [Nocardia sp. alder85J]
MSRAADRPFDPPPPLREVEPISRVRIWNGETPWLVTGYEAQRKVLADQRFSADTLRAGFPHQSESTEERRRKFRPFIVLDDPEHARLRKMLTRNFMIKRIDALRPRVQQIVDELIDAMTAGPKPVDLVREFALPVPSLVICELLGVPYADHEFFQACSRKIISTETPPAESMAAGDELRSYLRDLVAVKQQHPTDDMLGHLVSGQLAEGLLTIDQVADMGVLMLIAGHETTANMIGLGTLALLRHPDQLAELRDAQDPALTANAVEELLRYLTIVHSGRRRVATADVEVGGQLVRAGEGIILANDAGNRDGEAFPDPDTLDIHRPARHHVAFGYGVHQCLGQPLARMELQIVYGTLYRRIPTLRLAVPFEEIEYKHAMVVYGVHALPVTW